MSVPPGNVGGVAAGHGLCFHDEVLQDFVEGCTDVNISVCVRRAVMQKETFGGMFAGVKGFVVDVVRVPELKE